MPRELKIEWVTRHGRWRGVSFAFYRQDPGVGAEGGFRLRGWSKLETPPKLPGQVALGNVAWCREVRKSPARRWAGVCPETIIYMDLEPHS